MNPLLFRLHLLLFVSIFLPMAARAGADSTTKPITTIYDVRAYGATGDGKTIDTPAINSTIEAASNAGGGIVRFPAGDYLSVSIHLLSNVCLSLDAGATIIADDGHGAAKFDAPEVNPGATAQDFGHSHWHNGLIWGENLENISIEGKGRIWGKGLVRGHKSPDDGGDKAIALKLCKNITIKDITILHGGHFAILCTGSSNITIDNLTIDTNRDGIDIDSCNRVQITNCNVNAPFDDGICIKSSLALGQLRAAEDIVISHCTTTGYDEGTLLDGSKKRVDPTILRNGPVSRIKLGTESNGGFKKITITDCTFDYSRGLALESVDGGVLEDVSIDHIKMTDTRDSPIFIRLGNRMRGATLKTTASAIHRVSISNITSENTNPKFPMIISGTPGHLVEDIQLDHIHVVYMGGYKSKPTTQPSESEMMYPDPSMFGPIPAYGFYARHAKGIQISNMEISYNKEETRTAMFFEDITSLHLSSIKAQHGKGVSTLILKDITDFDLQTSDIPDQKQDKIDRASY